MTREETEILQGFEEDLPEAFTQLRDLLLQGTFELLEGKADQKIYRMVYLMNDTIESFLVFRNARMTGSCLKDTFEHASVSKTEDGYVLIVDQGESVFTLFFEELEREDHCFNYANVGHFWVKGHEYLRLLEYQIAILHDKWQYTGNCTAEEEKIAALADFPPLSYKFYASAPMKYVVEKERPWDVSKSAMDYMKELAKEVEDRKFYRILEWYEKASSPFRAKIVAHRLRRKIHSRVVDLLAEKICEAADAYKRRPFSKEDMIWEKLRLAEARQQEWAQKGRTARIIREEPFYYEKDSIEGNVYLMIWQEGLWNRHVKIEKM